VEGHKAKVRSLAFSPDGRFVATTAGNSKFVWLWEATTGKLVRKLLGTGSAMRFAAFLQMTGHMVGLHDRGDATVWDADTGRTVATLKTVGYLFGETLAVSPGRHAVGRLHEQRVRRMG